MKKLTYITLILALSAIGMSLFLYLKKDTIDGQRTTVFMDSFMVFEEFQMKKDYDKRLETEIGAEQKELDAIGAELSAATDPAKIDALKKDFTVKKLAFDEKFSAISQQYTAEVYKRLNEYIKAFGKERHYGFILGSNGQGNVMYVDQQQDVTKELIKYINKKYSN
jgi:outer membrane protein